MKGELTKGIMGAIVGGMNEACATDKNRRIALGWLFDYNDSPPLREKSSHDLNEGQWQSLYHWIDFQDSFQPSETFKTEMRFVLATALSVYDAKKEYYDSISDEDAVTKSAIASLGGQLKDKKGEH